MIAAETGLLLDGNYIQMEAVNKMEPRLPAECDQIEVVTRLGRRPYRGCNQNSVEAGRGRDVRGLNLLPTSVWLHPRCAHDFVLVISPI